MDFIFFTSVVNLIWQIFTILFILYRFTSFFSMMYNFILFIGKLFKGVTYIKDKITGYIAQKRGYSSINNNYERNQTWIDKIKSWIFGRKYTNLPLYETRTSFLSPEFNDINYLRRSHSDIDFEDTVIDSQYESDFELKKNLKSSIYPPSHRRSLSQPSFTFQQKPFNVADSNILFNSQFLTNVLNPENTENNSASLEKELLNSEQNEITWKYF